MNIWSLFADITFDHVKYDRALGDVEKRTDKAAKGVETAWDKRLKSSSAKLEKFGQRLQNIGKNWSLYVTAPITAMGGAVLVTAGNFEQSMNKVSALSGATGRDFERLRDQAKELGETTVYSASQAADAMSFLAMAGFDANTIYAAMPDTLTLAAAAQMDLASAADIVTNVMSGFGIEAEELGGAVDVLAKAFTSSNTDLVQLGDAFTYAGPVAKGAGMTFEETAAVLGLMGNAGIQASMAGTSLRGALTRLMSPTKQIQDVIDRLGLSTKDSNGNLLSMAEIIEGLEDTGATTADMMVLFGQRAGPAMAALVEQGSQAVRDLTSSLEDSAGTASEIAEKQMAGFKGAMVELRSAVEGLMIAIGDSGILEWAENAADRLAQFVRRLSSMSDETLRFGTIVAGVLAATGPVMVGIGLLVRGIGAIQGALVALRVVALPFLGPAGIVALLATGVIALNRALWDVEDTTEEFKAALERMQERAQTAKDGLEQLTEATDAQGFLGALNTLIEALDEDGQAAMVSFAESTAYPLAAQGELQTAIELTIAKFADLRLASMQTERESIVGLMNTSKQQIEVAENELAMITAMHARRLLMGRQLSEAEAEAFNRAKGVVRELETVYGNQTRKLAEVDRAIALHELTLMDLADGTITAAEAVERLGVAFDLVAETDFTENLGEKAKDLGEGVSTALEGSLAYMREQLAEAREEFENATTEAAREAAAERIRIVEAEIKAIEDLYSKGLTYQQRRYNQGGFTPDGRVDGHFAYTPRSSATDLALAREQAANQTPRRGDLTSMNLMFSRFGRGSFMNPAAAEAAGNYIGRSIDETLRRERAGEELGEAFARYATGAAGAARGRGSMDSINELVFPTRDERLARNRQTARDRTLMHRYINQYGSAGTGTGSEIGVPVFRNIDEINRQAKAAEELGEAFERYALGASEARAAWGQDMSPRNLGFADGAEGLEALNEAQAGYLDLIGEGPTAIDQYVTVLESLWEQYPQHREEIDRLIDGLHAYQQEQRDAAEAEKAREKTLETINGVTQVALELNDALGLGLEDVINGVANLATAIVSGNPFEMIAAGIQLASTLLGDFSNGMKDIEKRVNDVASASSYLGKELIDALAKINTDTVSRGGFLGALGFTKKQLNDEAFQAALSIAEGLANGIAAGMRDGVDAFFAGDEDWKDKLKEGIRGAIFDAIFQAFIEAAIAQAGVQDFILEFTRLYQEEGRDAAMRYAERNFEDVVDDVTQQTEDFVNSIPNKLRPPGPDDMDPDPGGTDARNFQDTFSFGRTPQSVQFAVATPLVEAAHGMMDAATIMRETFTEMGGNPQQLFADSVLEFGAYVDRLVQEGIRVQTDNRAQAGIKQFLSRTAHLR